MEKLTGQQLQVPEVTQSEEGQRNKLRIVLGYANRVLGLNRSQAKWSVDSVHTKNIVSILHLLVSNQKIRCYSLVKKRLKVFVSRAPNALRLQTLC